MGVAWSRATLPALRNLLRQIAAEHELEIVSGEGCARPRTRLRFLAAESGCQPDCAVAEGNQLPGVVAGISQLAEEVLGSASVVRNETF